MIRALLTSRRFAPLFWCQFLSAFNDNLLRYALVSLILFGLGEAGGAMLVTLAGAVFIAPSLILSGLGGEWADRYDKAIVAGRLKAFEILASSLSALGLVLHSVPILFVALFLFGSIAALFGPLKYAILPDHLRREELAAGNALVEGATFVAILLGTIIGGIAAADLQRAPALALALVAIAVLCWLAARFIPRTGEKAPDLRVDANILRSSWRLIDELRADRRILMGAFAVSWFWMAGAVVLSLVTALVKSTIGGDEGVLTLFMLAFTLGIAGGSLLAAWLMGGRMILILAPLGAIGMGLAGLDLAVLHRETVAALPAIGWRSFLEREGAWRTLLDLVAIAVSGGFLVVPTFASVQDWSKEEHRARVIAAVNVMTSGFIVAGALVVAFLQAKQVSTATILIGVSLANILAGIAFFKLLPMRIAPQLLWLLFRLLYRIEVKGQETIKELGPRAILAPNHVSFLDGPLVLAALDREPAFAVDLGISRRWWMRPVMALFRGLPMDPAKPMAMRDLIKFVQKDETILIFPEGRITVTGGLMKIYDGTALVADKGEAPIVPIRIDGAEMTSFARLDERQVPKRWFPKITVTVLPPQRLDVDAGLVGRKRRQAAGAQLTRIMQDAVLKTRATNRPLYAALLAAAERHDVSRIMLEDPVSPSLTYKKLLIGTAVLGRKIEPLAEVGAAVGVLLPNAIGAAATFFALQRIGRVPAMLNFTAGPANVVAACAAAKVETVLTSRAFIERGRLNALVEALEAKVKLVYLEDIRAGIGLFDKIRGLLGYRRWKGKASATDPAVILFTSGSEGAPKGVVLSHANILANCGQLESVIDFGPTDKVFNVLPVFHSFGLTAGMILPIISGVPLYLYPTPLHYRLIPEMIYGVNATILFGTDTFLSGYARTAHPYDLRSLRYVLAGAEAVKPATRKTYAETFGLRILEGYGITETAPVLAVNTPMFNRAGTVGRFLPGVEHRIEAVPGIEEGGRLFVRGPNIMLGYYRAENPGILEEPPEGWHDTGDIVTIDAQGFVAIKGRAKRFAKIGGEMVSLAAVEALVSDIAPGAIVAVAAMPDARKGERLVMAANIALNRDQVMKHLKTKGAADLMVPAAVIQLDPMPLLGSGKLDYVALGRRLSEAS